MTRGRRGLPRGLETLTLPSGQGGGAGAEIGDERVVRLLPSPSGTRSTADGCAVAMIQADLTAASSGSSNSDPSPPSAPARSSGTSWPRCLVIRNDGPNIALAAVAPRQTTSSGSTSASSASSHGRQAATCSGPGVWCSRRLPLWVKRKCFTAFVTYVWVRSMPASSSARSSSRPAGPTNGSPLRSSTSPGCSPTNTTRASAGPMPKTVWVAGSHSGQARQCAAASRRPSRPTPVGGSATENSLVAMTGMSSLPAPAERVRQF